VCQWLSDAIILSTQKQSDLNLGLILSTSCKAGNRNPIEMDVALMPNDLALAMLDGLWPLLLGRRCERYQEFLRCKSASASVRRSNPRSHVPPFQRLFQRVLSLSSSYHGTVLYFVCVLSNCSRCSKEKINNQAINNETDQLSGSQLTSSNGNFLSSFGPLAMLVAGSF